MAFNNNVFKGELHGKTIKDFVKGLDYSIDNVEDRVALVTKILMTQEVNGIKLPDKYFEDLFEQTFDVAVSREGVYWVDEIQKFLPYDQFMSWCRESKVDPLEYLDIQSAFGEIDYIGADKERGNWNYGGLNTSHIKLVLNTSDGLYTDSNIAVDLEKMADYILAKAPKEDKQEYMFYTDEDLFKKVIKEQTMISDAVSEGANTMDAVLHFLKDTSKNFNKEKKQAIAKKDVEELEIVEDYNSLKEDFSSKLREYKLLTNKRKREGKLTEEETQRVNELGRYRSILIKQVGTLRDDMLLSKDSIRGTIYFKRVSIGKGGVDWDMIDLNNIEHMRALLYMKPREDLTDDLTCIIDYVNTLMHHTNLSKQDKEIIFLLQEGIRPSAIAEKYGFNHKSIEDKIDSIAKRLIKVNEEIEEDIYFMNVEKGLYKKCRKCGDVKLATSTHFRKDSKSKDGYRATCKECEKNK